MTRNRARWLLLGALVSVIVVIGFLVRALCEPRVDEYVYFTSTGGVWYRQVFGSRSFFEASPEGRVQFGVVARNPDDVYTTPLVRDCSWEYSEGRLVQLGESEPQEVERGEVHTSFRVRTQQPQKTEHGTYFYDTYYDSTGNVVQHVYGGDAVYGRDAMPAPYSTEEALLLIAEAKLFVQSEAQRLRVTLPLWLEPIE
ncbi:MAG: hypothetical protein AAF581_18285 [Planctomycetota bacterium]